MKITLKAARVNAGLTQHEAAKRLHISTMSLVNWEKGKAKPTFDAVNRMSELYKCPIDFFIFP